MLKGTRCLVFVAVGAFCVCVGCERKPSAPSGAVVNCRVVIVLRPGEQPGGASNNGCRLTPQQVVDYMNALNAYGSHYGNNARFVWNVDQNGNNGPPLIYASQNMTGRNYNLIDWWGKDMNPNSSEHDIGWNEQAINIYFVGNLFDPNNQSSYYRGNTTDPKDAEECPYLPIMPHIFIADRGFSSGSGSLVRLGDRILEHEMCHFLIRARPGRPPFSINGIPVCPALPPQEHARYDVSEHDPNGTHLMKPVFPHGNIAKADSDETSGRVINNRYLLP